MEQTELKSKFFPFVFRINRHIKKMAHGNGNDLYIFFISDDPVTSCSDHGKTLFFTLRKFAISQVFLM